MVRPPVTSLAIHGWKEHGRPRPWQDPGSDREDATFQSAQHLLHEHQRHHAILAPRLAAARTTPSPMHRSWSTDEGLAAAAAAPDELLHQPELAALAGAPASLRAAERAMRRSVSHDADLRVPIHKSQPLHESSSPPLTHVHPHTDQATTATAFADHSRYQYYAHHQHSGLNELLQFLDADYDRVTELHTPSDTDDSSLSSMLVHPASRGSEQAVQASLIKSVLSDDNIRRHIDPDPALHAQHLARQAKSVGSHHLSHHARPPALPKKPSSVVERHGRYVRRQQTRCSGSLNSAVHAANPDEVTASETDSDYDSNTSPEDSVYVARPGMVSCLDLAVLAAPGRFSQQSSPLAGPSHAAYPAPQRGA